MYLPCHFADVIPIAVPADYVIGLPVTVELWAGLWDPSTRPLSSVPQEAARIWLNWRGGGWLIGRCIRLRGLPALTRACGGQLLSEHNLNVRASLKRVSVRLGVC